MKKQRALNSRGFTLLEVVIALAIVAVVALLSWQGLQEVLRMRDRLINVDDQLQTITAVFAQFEQDLSRVEQDLPKGQSEGDFVDLSPAGLLMLHTERKNGLEPVQRQTAWTLEQGNLLRVSRLFEGPEEESVSDPIAVQGISFRLWQEGVGWSAPLVLGLHEPLEHETIDYSGRANPLTGSAQGSPDQDLGDNADARVRAVEVSVTQTNGLTVRRVFILGGRY
ncbi:MAG: prepilin-type N-terminal cleavage/methylation domain-containing protein [Limnobacter sp.]|nr:prepilin-type N-terminal cleavage/methylation domain-containing protein [Limnobacter sp.]